MKHIVFAALLATSVPAGAHDPRPGPAFDIPQQAGLWDLPNRRKCSYKWRCQPY